LDLDRDGGENVREHYRIGAVAAAVMMAVMIVPTSISAGDSDTKWTFMVYLDADNNLEPYGDMNLEWLESVGSTGEVDFVVLMDTFSGKADLLHVGQGTSTSVGEEYGYPKEVNMGDPAVLQEFIEISVDDFEAEKYALILWNHGGGWRGLCWDDSSLDEDGEADCLTMVELRDAMAGAFDTTKEVMDVVGFDLCLMAMPEVAYQVRDYADYVVFSEETVPGFGFPYDTIAEDLVNDATMDGKELACMITENYAAYYASVNGYLDVTISAFDMAYMGELNRTVDLLGEELLDGIRVYMNRIQRDLIMAQEYYYPYNIDLKGFAMNLQADEAIEDDGIKAAAALVEAVVDAGVISCINGRHNYKSYGLAIYAPTTNEGMHHIKDSYIDVPFAVETSWYDFVESFSNFFGRTWAGER
jgi:clostripain